MHKFLRIFLLFLFLNTNLTCFAADNDTAARVYRLSNGHSVVIKEIHANPIITIDTWVKTGTASETKKINGVSHFLEHLMFKGTNKHVNGEIEKILESKGARFNAATSKDFTHYYVTIASDYVDTALKLHAEMLKNPAIPPEELQKERKVVQEEIRRSQDDPKRILVNDLFALMFKKHPYKMTTLGPHEIIENISRKEIFNYYNKQYVPSNLTTVIVGDVDTQKVLELMKNYFDDNDTKFKADKRSDNSVLKREPDAGKPLIKINRGNYKSGYLFMGYKGIPASSIKETYALDLAASILGGSRTSRLYQNIKENKDLVSDISATHYSLKDDSIFLISADFEPENFQQVKLAIQQELEKFVNNPVSEEELKRVKTLAKRSFIYSNESVENIAGSLGYCMTIIGNIDCYKKHIQYIDSITVYDIQKAAQKYLESKRMVLTALLPKEIEINNVVLNTKTLKESTRSTLSNGAVLITNKNESNDIIAMSVFFKGGVLLEPIPGTANLLTKNLLYGTKQRPYQELIKEIENAGIAISPRSANDYFEIKLKTTKNDFDKGFEILMDIINYSTFKEKYVEKNKKDLMAQIKKSRDYPVSIASENFLTELYKDHPYGHVGKVLEQNVPQITREDIVNYWNKTFIPENMVVSVSGDVDHKNIAHKVLASFPVSGKKPPEIKAANEFSPLKENKILKAKHDSAAAWIFMGWPVNNINDNREVASLRVMEAILSDGLSSRLHKTFREDQGLAYSVGGSYSAKLDKGHFVLYIGTEPKNIELVKGKFLEEIEKFKTKPISQKELEENKSKLIGNYALSQETNQYKAHLLGAFEVVDKKFGFNYDFPDLINQVTSEDIIRTANKYFNYPYVLSIVAPEKEEPDSATK